jgi:hypothetical protein
MDKVVTFTLHYQYNIASRTVTKLYNKSQ